MKVIGVISSKGGTGKTTIAVNLAVAACHQGITCQIVDLDEQGSATAWGDKRGDVAPHVVETNARRVGRALEAARGEGIALAIIDTPGRLTADYFEVSDLVLVPTSDSELDLEAIPQTVQMAAQSGRYGLVLNRLPPQADAAKLEKSLQDRGLPVAPSLSLRTDFKTSAGGQGVLEIAPKGKAAAEILALYRWIREQLDAS